MVDEEIIIENDNLLPEGLSDFLPPDASKRSYIKIKLCEYISSFGYNLVEPPLVEFEKTLLSGLGESTKDKIFRFIDPSTQNILAIRADMTSQIGRIVSTRLRSNYRPLRIMYSGDVLIVNGKQIKPERQFSQLGFELISKESIVADSEILFVAINSLSSIGIDSVSLDISIPSLLSDILDRYKLSNQELELINNALFQRDIDLISNVKGDLSQLLISLIDFSGSINNAAGILNLDNLTQNDLNKIESIFKLTDIIQKNKPKLKITVDFVENSDFNYHTGITFRIFSSINSKELGRGGRYKISHENGKKEDATGFTFFTDYLTDIIINIPEKFIIYIQRNIDLKKINEFRMSGYRVIFSLSDNDFSITNAKRLGCTHFFDGVELKECK